MGATLTTVSAITKEVYGPRIVDQLENETVLTKRMEKTSRGTSADIGGKYVTFPLKVRRNAGIGYRNELEQLQAAGQQGWQTVRTGLKYGYGRVHISGQTIKLVKTNKQAFAAAMTEEMTGLKDDIKKDTNRIMWGNSLGTLAEVDTADTTTNVVSVADVDWLDLDMMVDLCNSDGTVVASNRKITAINESTGDVTLDGAAIATVLDTDILVRTGNYGREPHGLASLVEDTTTELFNLDPATEPLWKGTVDALNGVISESRMINMCNTLRKKGGRPSAIFADLGSRTAYFNLLTTQRRFTGTKDFGGGFTGMTFSYDEDIPLVTDVDAPDGKMWFLREQDFTLYQESDWDWEDTDGNIWKWVTDYDAFEALLKKYWEFAIERRNTQGVITGITAG